MTAPPDRAVELLERALAYTRAALVQITAGHLDRPTPCEGWSLDRLLTHMDDGLDAFTEGAAGAVPLTGSAPLTVRVTTLQTKACGLLGAWSAPGGPDLVRIGDLALPRDVLARAAALEITVHGWDVAQATGHATPVPERLAAALLPVAHALVGDHDRDDRFAPPVDPDGSTSPSDRLVAFLGRRPAGPPFRIAGHDHEISTRRRPAS